MKYFKCKWVPGRQSGVKYQKCCILSFKIWKFGFDIYLLKYNSKTFLPFHRDIVKNGKHWRLNISLKGNSIFYLENKNGFYKKDERLYKLYSRPINFFRSDINYHALEIISDTNKLSFGFVKYK